MQHFERNIDMKGILHDLLKEFRRQAVKQIAKQTMKHCVKSLMNKFSRNKKEN